MLKEFKNFIMTGNVIEFAVAVIMAGAVGAVVNGFVADIVMPVVGQLTGGVDFADLRIILSTLVAEDGSVTENAIRYGAWINTLVNLVIVGLVMFLIIKLYAKTKKPVEAAPEPPKGPSQEELLAEIRDLLKK